MNVLAFDSAGGAGTYMSLVCTVYLISLAKITVTQSTRTHGVKLLASSHKEYVPITYLRTDVPLVMMMMSRAE